MIKTKKSAVTAISYGLIAALVAAVSLGALTAAGVNIENIFSIAGNALSSVMTPNPNLTAEQQSEVANAAAEIAAGTASAACLQNMNSSANAASMVSNNATCLGPGYGIAPPALPVAFNSNGKYAVESNGLIYAATFIGNFSTTSATAAASGSSIILYSDGQEMTGSAFYQERVAQCQTGGYGGYSHTVGTPSVIDSDKIICAGITDEPGWGGTQNNISVDTPLGYTSAW